MKLGKRLLALAVAMAMVFALAACGGSDTPESQQPEDTKVEQTQQPEPEKEEAAQPQATQEPEKEAEIQHPEKEPEAEVQHTESEPEEEPEKESQQESTFDAETAVTAEEIQDGVKYVFNAMPQNAQDIKALLEVYPQTDRHNTAAFFIAAVVRYIDDAEDGLAMIDALKGPQLMSDYDKSFIKERFSDKKYLPKAYFEGATPKNNYQPDSPWTLIIYDDPVSPPEGYSYVNVKTSGADSPRRICMRIKDDNHYLWEYNGILMSIRLPAEEDPWL